MSSKLVMFAQKNGIKMNTVGVFLVNIARAVIKRQNIGTQEPR